jgi:hypothetical protein
MSTEWERIPEKQVACWDSPISAACEVYCICSGTIPDTAPMITLDNEFRGQCSECGRVYRVGLERWVEVIKDYPRQEGG